MGIVICCSSSKKTDQFTRSMSRQNSTLSTLFDPNNEDYQLMNPFMKKHNLYNRLTIDEVYEVSKDILGKGGYGEVRTIIHRSARVERVAKIIFKRKSNDKMLKRIKQEIKVLS